LQAIRIYHRGSHGHRIAAAHRYLLVGGTLRKTEITASQQQA
jgi:hypothetical protein